MRQHREQGSEDDDLQPVWGEDESGRAPIDLGMAASKRGSFSVELGLSKKVPPLLADALLSEVPAPTQSTSVPECVLNKSRECDIAPAWISRDSGQQPSLRQPAKLSNGHRLVRSKSNLEEQGKELLQFEYFMGM